MYNTQTAKEEPSLPKDTIFDGVIIEVKDGKVKDFVKSTNGWKDPEQTAIELLMEIIWNERSITFKQIYTYYEVNGAMVYGEKSNFGKFKAKYGSLPDVGVKIKCLTNNDGFLRLKID